MTYNSYYSIEDFSVYVPSSKADVPMVAEWIREKGFEFPHQEVEKFLNEYRFNLVPVEEDKSLEEMIEQACIPILDRQEISGEKIDRIIFVKTSQVSWHEQNLFRNLRNQYQCIKEASFVALGQHNCATVHYALNLARNIFTVEEKTEQILLVTADKAFHPVLRKIPDSLNGDSSSAILLSRSGKNHRIIDVINFLDGSTFNGVNSDPKDIYWFNATYYFSLRQIILSILKKNQLSIENIKVIYGSNVNYSTWYKLSKMLDCNIEKFYTETIPSVGHLYCTDIIYNIKHSLNKDILKPGDLYLALTIGLGGSYGCSLHEY
ncbi:3-oxoacyl-[acyl-carrier-protein] synthase III C-terminal domain-containing protein [Cytobacillus oceanisediminis]|uniref:3-oxoacyl-[acyl-carrier-protein] synthase III C-terminal domain-containing protein n=1 Tax=Cytobacillus oceanisediminis TaxID=665099 RepID=UPI001C226866|nr:3-oxoacyl-[acyl-carrier-protein] synthase III C-terminal domain-containing protein [Cytobacillus oceanisediminis]MBU8772072.1 hypothetical protein [Cytobacillus oceanisediminis]